MILGDYTVRRIEETHIGQLFRLSKDCLYEKGVENIRDDLLMLGLKNALSKKMVNVDFGLFKLNSLVGFAFVEIHQIFYLKNPNARLMSIYLHPDHRTEENYAKMLDYILNLLNQLEIKILTTADNWTLCNDCEILDRAMKSFKGSEDKIYNLER